MSCLFVVCLCRNRIVVTIAVVVAICLKRVTSVPINQSFANVNTDLWKLSVSITCVSMLLMLLLMGLNVCCDVDNDVQVCMDEDMTLAMLGDLSRQGLPESYILSNTIPNNPGIENAHAYPVAAVDNGSVFSENSL